jgi:molybdenum cofactor cytidylyltransferase
MRLRDALRIQRGDVVAFVGAGGKTSALFRLAGELRAEGWRVLATTTTRLAWDEAQRAPLAVRLTPRVTPAAIREWLNEHGFVLLYSHEDHEQRKVHGLHPDMIAGLVDSVNSDVMLIEADGSRRLPLKAPYDHEPVIPPDTTLVVPVAGLDVLGQPARRRACITPRESRIVTVSRRRHGGPGLGCGNRARSAVGPARNTESARVVALLNKVSPNGYHRRRARRVAQMILRAPRIEAVALGAVQTENPVFERHQRVAAVVLAAGLSSRMGQSKACCPGITGPSSKRLSRGWWRRVWLRSVGTGSQAEDVARVLAKRLSILSESDYARGEMLSCCKWDCGRCLI